jgi:hypothetical protein
VNKVAYESPIIESFDEEEFETDVVMACSGC